MDNMSSYLIPAGVGCWFWRLNKLSSINAKIELNNASMPQKEIEIILARQLSSHLSMPVFIIGPEGTLLFYNEPAERILGLRFDETGEMPAEKWSTAFSPSNVGGSPLPREELPLMIALNQRRPAHKRIQIQGLDGVSRNIEVTAFPLAGQADRFLGAIAIFWEVKQ